MPVFLTTLFTIAKSGTKGPITDERINTQRNIILPIKMIEVLIHDMICMRSENIMLRK